MGSRRQCGLPGFGIRDVMLEAVATYFGATRAPHTIEHRLKAVYHSVV